MKYLRILLKMLQLKNSKCKNVGKGKEKEIMDEYKKMEKISWWNRKTIVPKLYGSKLHPNGM